MPTDLPSILFVITRGDSIGGAQVHVRDLVLGSARKGRRVAVAVGSTGPFFDWMTAAGVKTFLVPGLARSINPWADLKAIVALYGIVRRWKPDWVACHTAKAGMVGRIAAWVAGVPAQYTVHGWQFADGISRAQRLVVWAVETAMARLTRVIITVSDYDRSLALRYRVTPANRIVTVHNGMPDVVTPERTLGGATIRLVMVARFQPQKDHGTLLAALERLDDLPWTLQLVGDGPDLERWRAWVKARGWSSRVVFHGLSHQVASLLASSDVFVLASRWEGFPNSILEAMRAGLPVVASNVGGVAEAIVEGKTGTLVPAGDPEALAAALGRLMADRSLRQDWGRAGQARFKAEFTFDRMLEKTESVWSRP